MDRLAHSSFWLDVLADETFFFVDINIWLPTQVDKLYDEKDEDFDPREKDEEIARMREHVMSEVFKNKAFWME